MIQPEDNQDLLLSFLNNNQPIQQGHIGIEKESLRIHKSKVSTTPHDQFLGNSLCNSYITTDFSEAQIELITPPFNNGKHTISFLDDLHHYATNKIGDEYFWPLSMPIKTSSDSEIPIATYGRSNLGVFKEVYRKGLSHRYGHAMQIISGIHFNYSFPELIQSIFSLGTDQTLNKELTSAVYFRTIRNLHRMNWLILYLFGCSPVISKNLLNSSYNFIPLSKDYYFLPYATSLRMSDLGYQNNSQSSLFVSLNTLEEYTADLQAATAEPSKLFHKIFSNDVGSYPQISSNLLQIEDEHYGIARPKSMVDSNDRQTSKLLLSGVNYIEYRSMDINPFSRVGVEFNDLIFLEAFIIYCALQSSPPMSSSEFSNVSKNDLIVATRGREPKIKLKKGGKLIDLKSWAYKIFDEITPIIELMGYQSFNIENYRSRLTDPELTLSASLLRKLREEKIDYYDLGQQIGMNNKNHYMNKGKDSNPNWALLKQEEEESSNRNKLLESSSLDTFEQYVENYFSES
tara:strand:- start:53075 stop:54619 length:1545 start_codon:yes stop_codon:yes gene_type:complete